jgi:lysophospholipase L1-like esterase
MKLLVTIFGAIVLWIGYSHFLKPNPFEYNKESFLDSNTKILAFGDSLTRGTGANRGYPERLSGLLGVSVINEGIPAEVSKDGLKRLPRTFQKHKPDIVILCHGGNDILRRYNLNQTEQNLRLMIEYIQQNGAKVLLVGVPMFEGLSIDTASFYGSLAKEFNLPYAPKILTQIINNPDLKSDRVHPNDKGYEHLALRLRALVLEYFGH